MASLIRNLSGIDSWQSLVFIGLISLFQLWMVIHAIRKGEWVWVLFILFGWGIAAFLYYFYYYRADNAAMRGFELPGAQKRKRIKELQAQIHHLDNAYHHFQLGDVYFAQGKLDKAEACYRASLERDPNDIDARGHLGQCLLRMKRPNDARPLLEGVCAENPKHDYGYSLMALAETMTQLGQPEEGLKIWLKVTANYAYPRAKVQLAELYLAKNQPDLARNEVKDILADDAHAPHYQRKRDRVWVGRARSLMRKLAA